MTLDLLTPEDAAEILRVPVRTVVQLCAQGRIPGAAKVGRRWRIPRAGLDRIYASVDSEPHVYVLEALGLRRAKIGWSRSLRQRLIDLQGHSPAKLRLIALVPGDRNLESELHARFGIFRLHGEWFRLGPDLRRFCDRWAPERIWWDRDILQTLRESP